MNIAQTILSQIRTLDIRAFMAWGAVDFVNMGDGLKFRTTGMTPWKGQVYIKYNEGTDLYEIQFFRIRKAEIKMCAIIEDVYAEDLVMRIDEFVG